MTSELLAYIREVAGELVDDLNQVELDEHTRAAHQVAQAMDKCLTSLAATGLVGRDNQLPSGELWKVAGHLLQTGPLQHRARTKPSGYAGDDILLRQIHQHQICSHQLGRLFDQYFQKQDAPEAVRGRIQLATEVITAHAQRHTQPTYRIVSVGAGPAIEVELALQSWPHDAANVHVTLLDLDQNALDRAAPRLQPLGLKQPIHCVRENLFRLASHPTKAASLTNADFLACLGFFDYLEPNHAMAMLKQFWKSLRPGGQMLVGNFSSHCQARPYMEWVGNWYLVYRTSEELHALAAKAGIPDGCYQVRAESQGINLLLEATKPTS